MISDRIVELQSLAEANKVSLENLEQKIAANRRLAFLDLLILMKDKNQLTLEDIREEVDTFMFEVSMLLEKIPLCDQDSLYRVMIQLPVAWAGLCLC